MQSKRELVREKLNQIFQDVFDDENIQIWDEMSAADLDEWDSLMHISLVVATEKVFNLKLNVVEVSNLANVGDMINLLLSRAPLANL